MKDSLLDKAVKAYGKNRGRYEYDNALNGYFSAYYKGEEVYVVVRVIDAEKKQVKPGVTEVAGRPMYVVCTEPGEFGDGNIEGIMNIDLDELQDMLLDDEYCGGIIFNPWTAGFVVSREMIDEANKIY